jgi:NADPH-dependent 2,4-dienoyl-CoA reductase/sulfur reductase-like enzyme/nitrite reductase/ring-hydroxylating ferredoxin subunit
MRCDVARYHGKAQVRARSRRTMTDEGPDFTAGVPIEQMARTDILSGKVGEEEAILVRRGEEFFAIGAKCSHYGGPLAQGLASGSTLRCPLHHACFDLRTGVALHAPAIDPIPCWLVERVGDRLFVRERLPERRQRSPSAAKDRASLPSSVVIIGGGAAGLCAADTLRREGYDGRLTMFSADEFAPYDRPNLSKDYLAGHAPDDWIPLRPSEYYRERKIDLLLRSRVASIDVAGRAVKLENGSQHPFDRLLLATGSEPSTLAIPGAAPDQVHYLRTFADSQRLVEAAREARQIVVVGGSFIGLEVAASLRERGLAVHVVARDKLPLERVMGAEIGRFIRALHESKGVVFHLEDSVLRVVGRKVMLQSGSELDADLLVLGVGVRPNVSLAERAGLRVDRGVLVDEYLATSAPGIFAAGDIARWPDSHSGQSIRIEHWVVGERQGQTAARNMLGRKERFAAVPFFWTAQFGVSIRYVGHAEAWDSVEVTGDLAAMNAAVRYKKAGRTVALATLGRDLDSLMFEAEMEAGPPQGGVS